MLKYFQIMSCTGTSSDTGLHDQESGIPARRAFPGRSVDMAQTGSNLLRLGVDVGSTTVKTVVLDPTTNDVLFTAISGTMRTRQTPSGSFWRKLPGGFPMRGFG